MTARAETVVARLTQTFPHISGIHVSQDGSVHLGNAAEGGEIDGLAAADYYFSHTGVYENFGVHSKLANALESLGWFAEWYDPGTLYAFEN